MEDKGLVGEGPSNFLSSIIEKARRIERVFPLIERRAEQRAIVDAIKKSPSGKMIADRPELDDVVWAALGVANQREREIKKNPQLCTASPHVVASWFIFDELGVYLDGEAPGE